MKKNEDYIVEIEDLSNEGTGVAKISGFPVFIKGAITGDKVKIRIVKVKKNYAFGIVLELLTASRDRTTERCPVAKQCGGCQLQHMTYESQLSFKQKKVLDCMERIAGLREELASGAIEVLPILGMDDEPFYYRNKAQFPVGYDKNGEIVTGFYAGRTHSIIPSDTCHIQNPVCEPILQSVKEYMQQAGVKAYDEATGKGIVRHILIRTGRKTKDIMVCLVINADKLPKEQMLTDKLISINADINSIVLNINKERNNVILGRESRCIYGNPYIEDYIGEVKYRISSQSFYQVNPIQTEKLYRAALSFANLTGNEIVWDLYCGIGTISLFLAQKAKMVYGVEIVPQAIENAKSNAKLNHIENTEFFVGAAEEVLPDKYEKSNQAMRADVIVVDPPRKGCDTKLLDTLVKMQPDRIVYVSCDPATLARDVKILGENGYRVEKLQACDMFPQTVHVETVVQLVNIGVKPD